MITITKKQFVELANIHTDFCISIFIPTHKAGQAVIEGEDVIALKNQLKEITKKLERGHTEMEVKKMVAPIQEIIDDKTFWSQQSNGLAIFIADGLVQKYTLPIDFEPFNYVSNELYLKPLIPMFAGDERFFTLALELDDVNFYEGSKYSITKVNIEGVVPTRMLEVVGDDYEQKSLQFRSQQEGHGQASFHGHGEGKEDKKKEILKYFNAVDKGLMKILHDENQPMVVACLDHLFPIYKEANNYTHLLENHISGNPANMDIQELHTSACEVMRPYFDKDRMEKIALLEQVHDTKIASADIKEILPAALSGQVDTLFLQNRSEIWGIYDPHKGKIDISETHHVPNVSLMNMVAIEVILHGGKVYLLDKEEMPDPYSNVNALYRY